MIIRNIVCDCCRKESKMSGGEELPPDWSEDENGTLFGLDVVCFCNECNEAINKVIVVGKGWNEADKFRSVVRVLADRVGIDAKKVMEKKQ